jgi:hypothetical protein
MHAQSLEWAKTMGGTAADHGQAIDVDDEGNVYTTGEFNLTADMDPGPGVFTLTSQGSFEVFVQKMNSAGDLLWAKSFGGNSWDSGTGIATDGLGNVYVTGFFFGTVDFDPGAGTLLLTAAGQQDAFVVKLNNNGDLVWAKTLGGTQPDKATAIVVDSLGNAYIAGFFEGIMDADPDTSQHLLSSAGNEDAFVVQLDSAGKLVWAARYGDIQDDQAIAIELDPFGNIALTGFFQFTIDFDPGAGTFPLSSNGSRDAYVLKLTGAGIFRWAVSFGNNIFFDHGNGISSDRHGSIYTTGIFADTVDFDPGANVFNLTVTGNWGNWQTYIHKLDSSGNFVWAKAIGGPQDDWARGIDVNKDGDVFVTGHFQDTADFDPGPDEFLLTTVGAFHVYVLQLDSLGDFHWAYDIGSYQSIFANRGYAVRGLSDGTIYTTGHFVDTVDLDPGPDTLIIGTIGGNEIYVQKLKKCYRTYTTIGNTSCDSILWNNISYDSTGTYKQYFQKADGCDSVVTLNLVINTINTSVTQSGGLLTADETGATYQWLNCLGMNPISGATNQSYTATTNGDYAVIVTSNTCSDTSVCTTVTGVGVVENNFGDGLLIYPNPTDEDFSIDLGDNYLFVSTTITDLNGKIIQSNTYDESQLLELKLEEPAGVYLLIIKSGNKKAIIRIVKE